MVVTSSQGPSFRVALKEEGRLDAVLSRLSGRSRESVKAAIASGSVQLNGRIVEKASARVKIGDQIDAHFADKYETPLVPIEGQLEILYEDDELLALNKPAGLVVHPASGHQGETLVHHLLHYLRRLPNFQQAGDSRPGIVHRLDKGTSGVLVIGKSRTMVEKLAKLFHDRHVEKEYESIVLGGIKKQGRIESTIGRHRTDRYRMSAKTQKGRRAVTRWECNRVFGAAFSHVALFPHTGRTHQLRVHLSEQGHPIVGDKLYGYRLEKIRKDVPETLLARLRPLEYPLLHAKRLKFIHPTTGREMDFVAEPSAVFSQVLSTLERSGL